MYKETANKNLFGFWVYLMTDLLSFAALFATFAVLRNNTFGGPAGNELFSLPYVLTETLILLTSSFTAGLATLAMHKNEVKKTLVWFSLTFILGATFLGLEIHEFAKLAAEGNTPQRSAFLSSFFTLVGTHGLHITVGLLWLLIILIQVLRKGLNPRLTNQLQRLSLFWHFLDIVWIFIFTIVYLLGAI